jgi:mannose-6-phosphate isomerase-like protein (cupin superfamily)
MGSGPSTRARLALLIPLAFLSAPAASPAQPGEPAAAVPPSGLILPLDAGERRVRRSKAEGVPGLNTPFIIKVDRRNGGSRQLVMGYEEIAPGDSIRPHRHLVADEIIFVHSGSGSAELGSRTAPVAAGGTVYIPRNTRIALHNDGKVPLGIAFIFSAPGFEELMRENSVREGEPDRPLTVAERRQIEARNAWHTVHEDH